MPRIALDARMLGEELHGLGRYVYALASAMARLEPDWDFVLLGDSRWARGLAESLPNVSVEPVGAKPFSAGEQIEMPRVLGRVKPDLFHATTVALPLVRPGPFVITVPDLIPLVYGRRRMRNRIYFEQYLPRALHAARGVLVFSEAVRQDLRARLGVSRDVAVVPLGVDPRFTPQAEEGEHHRLAARYGVPGEYLLVTGNPKPHKNLHLGVETFGCVRARPGLDHLRLVLHSRLSSALEQSMDALHLRDWTHRVGHVQEEDLPALYRQAMALFYPSQYEGFGLPVLEAMACGTPVVSSDATSLPEVVGDAGVLVRVGDRAACADAVARVCLDTGLRSELSARGVRRASRFTWNGTARATLSVYRGSLGMAGDAADPGTSTE